MNNDYGINWLDIDDLLIEFRDRLADRDKHWSSMPPEAKKKLTGQVAKQAQTAIKPFQDWLERSQGHNATHAAHLSHTAWLAIVQHPANPARRLLDEELAHPQKATLRTALREFASYLLQTPKSNAQEQAYARRIINAMSVIPLRDPLTVISHSPRKKGPKATDPMPEDDVTRFLEAIETRHIREGSRHPWARPLLRIATLVGLVEPHLVVQIEKKSINEAVIDEDQGRKGGLTVWSRKSRSRIIPVSLIEAELRALAYWPVPWGTVADLMAQGTENPSVAAINRYRAELAATAKEAGIFQLHRTALALKKAALVRLYKEHKDLIQVQAVFGYTIRGLKKMECMKDLLAEERQRMISNIE